MTDKGYNHPHIQALIKTIEDTWRRSVSGQSAKPAEVVAAIGAALSGMIRAATRSKDAQRGHLVMVLQVLAAGFPEICLHCQIQSLIIGRLKASSNGSELAPVEATVDALAAVSEVMAELIAVIDGDASQQEAIAILNKGMPKAVADARERVSALQDLVGRTAVTKH